jgi:hypothetical protein
VIRVLQRDLDPTGDTALILGIGPMLVELNYNVHLQAGLAKQIAEVFSVLYLSAKCIFSENVISILMQKMNVKYIIAPIHIVPAHYVLVVADVQARTMSVFDPFQYSCCIGDMDKAKVKDLMKKMRVCLLNFALHIICLNRSEILRRIIPPSSKSTG